MYKLYHDNYLLHLLILFMRTSALKTVLYSSHKYAARMSRAQMKYSLSRSSLPEGLFDLSDLIASVAQ